MVKTVYTYKEFRNKFKTVNDLKTMAWQYPYITFHSMDKNGKIIKHSYYTTYEFVYGKWLSFSGFWVNSTDLLNRVIPAFAELEKNPAFKFSKTVDLKKAF